MDGIHPIEPVLSKPQHDVRSDKNISKDEMTRQEGAGRRTSEDAQEGVRNIEAVSMIWSKWGLIAAYTR